MENKNTKKTTNEAKANEETKNEAINKILEGLGERIEFAGIEREVQKQVAVNITALEATFGMFGKNVEDIDAKYITKLIATLAKKAGYDTPEKIVTAFKEVSYDVIKEVKAEQFVKTMFGEEK